jgi:hypothetical protein
MYKMAQLNKTCNQCNKSKPISEFHKRSKSPDGLQFKCKACFKVINQNFREAKPYYQVDWQRTNHTKWLSYITDWAKKNVCADDSRSALYYIVNPENKIYVGSTQTLFSARKSAHKVQYKNRNRRLPLLHQSFDMYGWDKHKWYIVDMSGVDRQTLRTIEYQMINELNKNGMSLNVRLK